jgi:hypothetical protein
MEVERRDDLLLVLFYHIFLSFPRTPKKRVKMSRELAKDGHGITLTAIDRAAQEAEGTCSLES